MAILIWHVVHLVFGNFNYSSYYYLLLFCFLWYCLCVSGIHFYVCAMPWLFFCSLQWVSAHSWVMLVCVIGISENWAYTGNTVHFARIPFLDSLGLYFWIPISMYFLLLWFFVHNLNFQSFTFFVLNVPCSSKHSWNFFRCHRIGISLYSV